MMKRHHLQLACATFCAAFALTGCNSSTSTTSPATPPPGPANVAGQYRGTVDDSVYGTGRSLGDFSQTGASVGGRLQFTYASKTVANSVALALSRANALNGTAVATIGSAACTFTVSSTYDPVTFRFTGNYTAAAGCSGESGSFGMKEACFYQSNARRSLADADRRARPNASGLHPC